MENSHKTEYIRSQFVLCNSVFDSVVSLPTELNRKLHFPIGKSTIY